MATPRASTFASGKLPVIARDFINYLSDKSGLCDGNPDNSYSLSIPFFQLLTGFAINGLFHFRFAFIVKFFALRDPDLELDPAVFPVDSGDDQSHSLDDRFALEFLDRKSVV